MTVTSVITSEGCLAEVTGVGYNPIGDVKLRNLQNGDAREVRQSLYNVLEVIILLELNGIVFTTEKGHGASIDCSCYCSHNLADWLCLQQCSDN